MIMTFRLKRHFIPPTIEKDGDGRWSGQGAWQCYHGNKEKRQSL